MKLDQYWTLIMKQWRLLIVCFLAVGVGTYIGSKLLTPIYQSTSLVQVVIRSGTTQSDINSLLASDQLVQTESLLATSDPVLREVVSHYKDLTLEQLVKEVTSITKPNTQVFEIDVQDASSTRAAALANDIASTLIKQQLQVTTQDNSRAQQQIQQDLIITRQQIDTVTTQLAGIRATGGNSAQIAVLQAQLNGLQQHYSQWQSALAQLELTEAQNTNFLRVVQEAQPGPKPVLPNVLLNTLVGLLAGLFLGMLLVILRDRLDMRVHSSETLAQILEAPVLATIWRAGSSQREDVIHPKGRDANMESYRILRTNVGFASVDKPLHSLVVTSAMPGDGKSVVATNLAIFMAKAGKNTLLVDADLRRPTLHYQLDLSAEKKGLSNAILAFSTSQEATQLPADAAPASLSPGKPPKVLLTSASPLDPFLHSVNIPHLWVMPSGPLPPNPPELLDSKAMQRLLASVAQWGFEVVIFDTPPLLGLSDASIMAAKVDGTIVVVDITRSDKTKLKRVRELLTQAGAHMLGTVVNKERRNPKDVTYAYYYTSDAQKSEDDHSANNGHSPTVSSPVSSKTR
jgi:tyrosine-protein kinase